MSYCHINTWTRPSRLYSDVGVLKEIGHSALSYQIFPADGDKMQMFFMARGTEIRLCLGTSKDTNRGIFDIYVNGVLDSVGYDDYNAGVVAMQRYILFTQPIRKGYNIIELRMNGKNPLATNFYVQVYGASIQ